VGAVKTGAKFCSRVRKESVISMGRLPCVGVLRPRQVAKKSRGSRPVFLLSHSPSKVRNKNFEGAADQVDDMDRQVGEVSEGLVLDLSVQSKRATEVIAGIGHTLDGVGDFSNVDCSWFAYHSPNIPGRVGDSQGQAEKILATNCSRNRSEVLFYQ